MILSYYLNMIFLIIDMMVMVLLSVGFLTLLERKMLSYIQLRKGPNKVGIIGLLQPISDGMKLFLKEMMVISMGNYYYYLFSPMFMLFLMLIMWSMLPYCIHFLNSNYQILLIFCFMSLSVYGIMIGSWSSDSLYAMLGSMRSIAQTISYEVSFMFIIFTLMVLCESFNLYEYMYMQYYLWFIILLYPVAFMFFVSLLAEMHRTPFDFSESESELVSGFNVEYMSGSFALYFIAEYGMILFMMYFFSLLFLGGNIYSMLFYLNFMMMVILVVWIRGTLPRTRYDLMMNMIWKSYLMGIMLFMIFICALKMLITLFI